ncbi:MAG: universal stress protein [Thaumarchaeota archaeon]|nr:universal stress protein [Nitrososphaerota archaeon]MDE1839817.1 universal stress protein [Nitrososphaerota archaeon]
MKGLEINKILVSLDGSKNSFKGFDYAIYLARQCHSTVTGLCVVPIYPPLAMPGLTSSSFRAKMTKDAKKFLDDAKIKAAQNGIVFNQKIIYGIPTEDIVNFSNKHKFDLVIIGHRGHGAVREMFLGSVANSTVHKSKVPVLVIK